MSGGWGPHSSYEMIARDGRHLEAAMIRLEDTSGGAVAAAIAAERHRMGSAATGMVLTLLILTDEEYQADATAAAVAAARQHPMRIVTIIPRPSRHEPRLDAEIAVGGDDGPGEVAVLRLRGQLAEHANSVAIPLLLTDTPVVAYWPEGGPAVPEDDPIGRHAQRRITDAATAEDVVRELEMRRDGYRPGDTDLSWTRLTPWRSVLASVLDQPTPGISAVTVSAEDANPSAVLLADLAAPLPQGAGRAGHVRRPGHHRGPPGHRRAATSASAAPTARPRCSSRPGVPGLARRPPPA